jgi:hypothetical protein
LMHFPEGRFGLVSTKPTIRPSGSKSKLVPAGHPSSKELAFQRALTK